MFSFSLRWLWAQCLLIAAGLFLMGYLADPGTDALVRVEGKVEQVAIISRKGLGSFYELLVQSGDGDQQRVLIAHGAAEEAAVRGLVGRAISAQVNLSAEAVDFATDGYKGVDPARVRQAAHQAKANYNGLAMIFTILGIVIGLCTIALSRQRGSG